MMRSTDDRRTPSPPFARGELVIVVDDDDRENEGDLIMAAEKATPEAIGFMIRHTSGVICLPLTGERLDALELPLMVARQHRVAAHRVHRLGRRARTAPPPASPPPTAPTTIRALRRSGDTARRPGPARPRLPAARARRAACSRGAGHTEAAVDLARLAGLRRRACWPRSSTTTARWRGAPSSTALQSVTARASTPPLSRTQREGVTWTREVLRPDRGSTPRANRRRPICAEIPVVIPARSRPRR